MPCQTRQEALHKQLQFGAVSGKIRRLNWACRIYFCGCRLDNVLSSHRKGGCLNIKADLYNILKIPETATKAEIKTAYRQLARKLHPDANSGQDVGRHNFEALTDAYSVLSNNRLRERYDRMGYAALGAGYARYATLHDQKPQRRPPEQGRDVMSVMWLDLIEAALGVERSIQVKIAMVCPECKGYHSRAAVSTPCPICRGTGEIKLRHSRAQGELGYPGPCPGCGGKGAEAQQWCRKCGSRGMARVERSLQVRVPPGVDDNSVLRLKGSGDLGRFGGRPGDVYVSFVIRSRPDILRKGLDLTSQITVAYTDAILGSVYRVQTIRGTADLVIPAGTQHGAVLKLAGGGIEAGRPREVPDVRSGTAEGRAGSHLFNVVVRLPAVVGTKEREILERLAVLQRPS